MSGLTGVTLLRHDDPMGGLPMIGQYLGSALVVFTVRIAVSRVEMIHILVLKGLPPVSSSPALLAAGRRLGPWPHKCVSMPVGKPIFLLFVADGQQNAPYHKQLRKKSGGGVGLLLALP
jgi:hypothetical protein